MRVIRYLIAFVFLMIFFCGYSQKKVRIACVGNNTANGLTIGDKSIKRYPSELGMLLGQNYEVHDFSENGSTLLQKGNPSYLKSSQYQSSIDFQPDRIFIMLGKNDASLANRAFLNDFVQDYKDLIFSYQNLPSRPQVVLLLPAPISASDSSRSFSVSL